MSATHHIHNAREMVLTSVVSELQAGQSLFHQECRPGMLEYSTAVKLLDAGIKHLRDAEKRLDITMRTAKAQQCTISTLRSLLYVKRRPLDVATMTEEAADYEEDIDAFERSLIEVLANFLALAKKYYILQKLYYT